MSEFGLYQVRPSTLRFTHDSVSCRFSNGLSLEETFRQFLYDELDVDDMPCLVAMYYNGKWLVVRGNRRLYLYKKLEKIGKVTTVEVDKQIFEQNLFKRQYTSKNMGVSIRIRGFPNIENVLNQITNEWRNTQGFQISTKPARRRRHRSKSRPRSENTNAVTGYSVQSNTAGTGSHTLGGNSNHIQRQTNRPPTLHANQKYSGSSMGNVNQPTSTSYKTTPTPSVNRSYPGMSQTNVQTPRSTGLQGNNSLAGSHTSGGNSNRDYLPSRCSCYKTTTTPSVTQNRALTSKMYVPPPRSNEYKAPTPSVNHNSSWMSHPNDHQPITDIVNFPQPELQRTKRKDNNCGCCTIL